jgi:hypothetical protein
MARMPAILSANIQPLLFGCRGGIHRYWVEREKCFWGDKSQAELKTGFVYGMLVNQVEATCDIDTSS